MTVGPLRSSPSTIHPRRGKPINITRDGEVVHIQQGAKSIKIDYRTALIMASVLTDVAVAAIHLIDGE